MVKTVTNHLSKRWPEVLLWLITAAVFFVVINNWYFPISDQFQFDEYAIFPEHLWFRTRWQWLQYLLFMNQTRLTSSGDFMLYRPGLFFWIWLQDVLFRTARLQQSFCLIGVAFVGFFCSWFVTHKRAGNLLAAAGALYGFTCVRGLYLYNWPHINGYLISMGLYALAGALLVDKGINSRKAVGIGVLFFISEIFHEFSSLTLVALILIELLFWRTKKDHKESNLRLMATLGPLAAYGLVVVGGYLYFRPPSVYSPADAQAVNFGSEMWSRIFNGGTSLIFGISDEFLPFMVDLQNFFVVRGWIGIAALVALTFVTLSRIRKPESRRLTVVMAAFGVMFFGLIVGRIAARGTTGPHYYSMYQYFLAMALVMVIPESWPRWRKGLLALVLLASSLRQSNYIRQGNELKAAERQTGVGRTIDELVSYFNEHEHRCFGGMFDPRMNDDINSTANMALLESLCGWHEGTPAYFKRANDGSVTEFAPPMELPEQQTVHLINELAAPVSTAAFANFFKTIQHNRREVFSHQRHDGTIKIRAINKPVFAREVFAKYRTEDEYPEMYNVGVVIKAEGISTFFILSDNVFKALFQNDAGQYRGLGNEVQLPLIKKEFTLRIREEENSCMVFFDDFLLTTVQKCMGGPLGIGTFSFSNATAEETLLDFGYR